MNTPQSPPAAPSQNQAAAAEHVFEKLRQDRETRNEVLINYLLGAHLLVVFVVNLANLCFRFAPGSVAPENTAVFGVGLTASLALFFYLRSRPAYVPARKYFITAGELLLFTAGPLSIRTLYSPLFASLVSMGIYMLVIVICSLRYSTRLVLVTGAVATGLHAAVFGITAPAPYHLPVLFIGAMLLLTATAAAAYSVSSLIRMHHEAALKDHLARFLSPELVDHVARQPDLLQRKTERRVATVIFTDIRGFTRYSEQMPPEKVVEFLNLFLEEMTAGIMNHQGMLDKYIGDAVMGVFGVPFAAQDHAQRALRAALDMRDRLSALNRRLVGEGLPELSVGIGLHTGELLIGAIGSTRRLDYTVIGDTVNVASRIEGMTRSYPVEILLSDDTRQALGNFMELFHIATVQVKNRDEPITVWSPDPPRED